MTRAYLRLGHNYTGVNPTVPDIVYVDRTVGSEWEEVELTRRGDIFLARFVAANVALSLIPDGTMETRPPGTNGAWEQMYCTTQPDGANLLYRTEQYFIVSPVLTIEPIL